MERRLPPRTGVLAGRENRLSEMAAGAVVTRVQELVDPARCRIWSAHNRDYAALSDENCADLIGGLRAQGRQEVPAIVRRVVDEPAIDFEVICGARRHWSVSWLRRNGHPEFRFLVEPRELTDEEAFRVADLENRHRRDLSDYERAVDYARALDRYYGGSQQRMLERLDVSKSWLSRYLELARLPPEVLDAFGARQRIGISHAARLAPVLKHPARGTRLVEAAARLASEQHARLQAGQPLLDAAAVTRRLLAPRDERASPAKEVVIRDDAENVLLRGQRARGGSVSISIPATAMRSPESLLAAFEDLLSRFRR